MFNLIENCIGYSSISFRAKLYIFYFLTGFCFVYLFGLIYFSIIDKSLYEGNISYDFIEKNTEINFTQRNFVNGKSKWKK